MTCKFARSPDQSNYGLQIPGARSNMLDGAASRYSKDYKRNSRFVDVQWVFDDLGYQYARSHYRTGSLKGTLSFPIDLSIEENLPIEYTAKYVPGSWKLAGIDGQTYIVQATLEVKYNDASEAFQQAFAPIFNVYDLQTCEALNLFNEIVNVNWPQA